jgi:small subunit ribosomal protein S1
LPKSKISKSQKPAAIEALREGDSIAVAISEIALQARKISLAPGDSADEQNWQKFADDAQSSLGSLGEKLQQALAAKKSDV